VRPVTNTHAEAGRVPGHEEMTAVWESHPNEAYRRDMSHWRGHGRWPDDAWAAMGAATRAQVLAAAAMLGRDVPRGPLLEWGPGGGTNLVAFAGIASRIYGADLSPSNLAECARVLEEQDRAPAFRPILVGDDPTAVAAEVDEPLELFISTAVFQHFPSRDYGAVVLQTVASLLAPGAIGCVQIRYDDGTPKYVQKHDDYRSRHITFTSYPLNEFWDLLAGVGLRPLAITAVNSAANYATFTFVPG
jgi:SAM-dependent methyltransferase